MYDLSKPWPFSLSRRNWWLFAIAFVVLEGLLLLVDHQLSDWGKALEPSIRDAFASITDYGESGWILIPAGGLFVITTILFVLVRWKLMKLMLLQMAQLYAFIFVGVGLPSLFATIVKRIIGRGRPSQFDDVGMLAFHPNLSSYSFQSLPSGHAATAFGLAFVIAFLAERWYPFALLFGIAIGISRIVVGAHYPTDVVAGAVVGVLGAYLVRAVFASRRWMFEADRAGRIRTRALSSVKRYIRLKRKPQAAR